MFVIPGFVISQKALISTTIPILLFYISPYRVPTCMFRRVKGSHFD